MKRLGVCLLLGISLTACGPQATPGPSPSASAPVSPSSTSSPGALNSPKDSPETDAGKLERQTKTQSGAPEARTPAGSTDSKLTAPGTSATPAH